VVPLAIHGSPLTARAAAGSRSIRAAERFAVPLALALSACGGLPPAAPALSADPAGIEHTVFLIGDAGHLRPGGEPVFDALARLAPEDSTRGTLVFMGDNIYPAGLPAEGHHDRQEAEEVLEHQIGLAKRTRLRTIFIPGNHDWARHTEDGWNAVRRQAAFIAAHGPDIVMLPVDGCPGPEIEDVGTLLRLIALDTQWWLHPGSRPGEASSCGARTASEVVARLTDAIASSNGRHVVVLGHHPLATGGEHGGHFQARDHLFPLRSVVSWLWVPLPGVGSLYPMARANGYSPQDLSSPVNRVMREALARGMEQQPPLVYAAGHEHNLQVIRGNSARWLLVSGAGISDHQSWVTWSDSTAFAAEAAGFMRLDVMPGGRVRLGLITVESNGDAREAFSLWLD
jgi:hypothetical protein